MTYNQEKALRILNNPWINTKQIARDIMLKDQTLEWIYTYLRSFVATHEAKRNITENYATKICTWYDLNDKEIRHWSDNQNIS